MNRLMHHGPVQSQSLVRRSSYGFIEIYLASQLTDLPLFIDALHPLEQNPFSLLSCLGKCITDVAKVNELKEE